MKKRIYIIYTLVALLFSASLMAQSSIEAASEAYRAEDYPRSIQLYEQVVAQDLHEGRESAEVYYNLGNAYFRNGDMAKAILNYERSLLLNPGDKDTRHNLQFARTRIEDKIDVADQFFFTNWVKGLKNMFNSNTWAGIGIGLFIAFLLALTAYFFIKVVWVRKVGFYSAIVLFVLMLVANSFAFNQKSKRLHRNSGIIMPATASVMASPDANSQELFRLHEGTKVRVNKTDGNWVEVEIATGNVGWTSKENIETI